MLRLKRLKKKKRRDSKLSITKIWPNIGVFEPREKKIMIKLHTKSLINIRKVEYSGERKHQIIVMILNYPNTCQSNNMGKTVIFYYTTNS